uniref:Uncharacterized protein n=1 Tax=Eutreptiella gymnastica TaxID=73025 RepID=A0A7S1J796_9EUGL
MAVDSTSKQGDLQPSRSVLQINPSSTHERTDDSYELTYCYPPIDSNSFQPFSEQQGVGVVLVMVWQARMSCLLPLAGSIHTFALFGFVMMQQRMSVVRYENGMCTHPTCWTTVGHLAGVPGKYRV